MGSGPPMSTTTTSPLSTTRSDRSWCGLAPFGPDPTITNAASRWPSSTIAAAMSAPTCASVRPALRNSPIRACTRSIAAPAARSCADLGGVLADPQLAHDRAGEGLRGLGQGVAQPEHVHRGHRVGHRDPGGAAGEVADQQVRVLAVVPGDDLDAELVERQVRPARRLQPRHDQRGRRAVPGGGEHEAGQALVARAVGVEEVAQVGARGDQQQLDVLLGGDVAGPPDPVGEQRGGNGRCHARQYAPLQAVVSVGRCVACRPSAGPWHTAGRARTADAPRLREPVLPRLLRRPGVDHRAGRHARQRRARVLRHGLAAAHRPPSRTAGGLPGPGLAAGVPGGGAAVVQGAPGRREPDTAPAGIPEVVPDTLAPQVPVILEVLAAAGLATAGAEGYEADDVIGTLCAPREAPTRWRWSAATATSCRSSATPRRRCG